MDAISSRFRELRQKAEMRQGDLSPHIGITQNMISNYENGREPPYDVLISYMKYFNVSADYLLGVTEEKQHPKSATIQTFTDVTRRAAAYGAKETVTHSDIVALFEKLLAYYEAGAPAGNAPIEALAAFLHGLSAALDASMANDIGALLASVNETVTGALQVNHMLTSPAMQPGDEPT